MPAKRALITGISGFCGTHLAVHLQRQGYQVSGLDIAQAPPPAGIPVHAGDIRERDFVQRVVRSVRPTHIFHLAALISPDANLDDLYAVNVRGTEHLLEAVRLAGIEPVILVTGSSAVYGLVHPDDLPIRESLPFQPLNPYAVSKIAQEMLAYTHYARYGLQVIRTRAFNLTGPGEPPSLVCSAFAKQIAEIEAGWIEPVLRVGNLTPQRDFVDVRDVVHAYHLAAELGKAGQVYNVCSGRAIAVQTCLDQLLRLATRSISLERDPARMRPADIPVSVGDGSRLQKLTGWQPARSLEESLADLLNDWRQRIWEM
jgi:GDP-4-dehydro-6-deoxy-D-mannose reductase